MSQNVYFYKGLYKVKVVTQSQDYWVVEAQEDFQDTVNCQKVTVKTGQTRIVEPKELHKRKPCLRQFQNTLYERKLEKKVKKMVEDYEKKQAQPSLR
jgi:hypothetical protein